VYQRPDKPNNQLPRQAEQLTSQLQATLVNYLMPTMPREKNQSILEGYSPPTLGLDHFKDIYDPMEQPDHRWNCDKFDMQPDDVFTLHKQFNTVNIPVLPLLDWMDVLRQQEKICPTPEKLFEALRECQRHHVRAIKKRMSAILYARVGQITPLPSGLIDLVRETSFESMVSFLIENYEEPKTVPSPPFDSDKEKDCDDSPSCHIYEDHIPTESLGDNSHQVGEGSSHVHESCDGRCNNSNGDDEKEPCSIGEEIGTKTEHEVPLDGFGIACFTKHESSTIPEELIHRPSPEHTCTIEEFQFEKENTQQTMASNLSQASGASSPPEKIKKRKASDLEPPTASDPTAAESVVQSNKRQCSSTKDTLYPIT